MTAWACAVDDVRYSVGAPACPQCGATDHYEAGSPEHAAALAGKRPAKGRSAGTASSAASDTAGDEARGARS